MTRVAMPNYYQQRLMDAGESLVDTVEDAATAYLEGKPALRGKHKVTRAERHAAFWASSFLTNLPSQAWQSQAMMLALAQYMGQELSADVIDRWKATGPGWQTRRAELHSSTR